MYSCFGKKILKPHASTYVRLLKNMYFVYKLYLLFLLHILYVHHAARFHTIYICTVQQLGKHTQIFFLVIEP